MKRQIILISTLTFMAIAIVSSCKKDPIPNNNEPSSDTIHFGDTTGMIITTYDTIMEFDDWHPFILDLNNDGINDIKIETVFDGPMMIDHQTLTLYCLNNYTKLLGEAIEKESYAYLDTIYNVVPNWDDTTMVVMATCNHTYSTCGKTTENDQVYTSQVFEVSANDFNDTFSKDDNFQSENIKLFRQDIDYGTMLDYETADTIFLSHQNYIYHCWNFPTDVEKYIGFKFKRNDKSYLGWLKIKLQSTWEGKVVNTELIETAIQK